MRKLAIVLFLATSALAGEGMWMPQQMPQLAAELQPLGIDANRLSNLTGDPLGAVVSLGGCTASFVSPDGLVVTNHHCAFGSIQQNSSPERDLITNGFLARTRAEELPAAPGTKVWVTTNIEDVTAKVTAGITAKTTDIERAKLLDRREKELVGECEKPGGVRCRVSSFFEGSQYLRLTQAEINDVRLVYAPARMIGEYGGEIDNFEWPRHTGDFSFYRAYVDGKPYHPKHWLKVATQGVSEGDPVIVAGYPGRTFRYKTADEVRYYQDFVYPTNIRYFTDVMRMLEEAGKESRDIQIRNASRVKSLANSLKNYTSVNEGFTKDHIVEARLEREAKMRAVPGDVLDAIAKLNAEAFKNRERDAVLDWIGRGSPMMQQAITFARLATERPKKDMDRVARYQEREWANLKSASDRAQRTIEPTSDRAVVAYFLKEAVKYDVKQLQGLSLDELYASTKIGDQAERTKMLNESVAQLKARNDSMLNLAFALLPLFEEREQNELAYIGAMARLRPAYFDVLRKLSGGTLYPDANSTLRLTIGRVEGYSPKDATMYTSQTSLRGVVEKETGKDPFESPKTLLAAAAIPAKTKPYFDPELGDVPVNFLSTCDTTGGNSGSPTLNAKGELVGLLFDGNYESIDADFLFNPKVTRSIHVDAQYMLWVMDAVDGAHELMKELGVTPKF
jgi:hypothetical protein